MARKDEYKRFKVKVPENVSKISCNTLEYKQNNTEMIKAIQCENGGGISSGYRKINLTAQKRKRLCQKLNKMLGGGR